MQVLGEIFRVANDHDRGQIFGLDCPIPTDYRQNSGRCSTSPTRILKSIMISESHNRPSRRSLASLEILGKFLGNFLILLNRLPDEDDAAAVEDEEEEEDDDE